MLVGNRLVCFRTFAAASGCERGVKGHLGLVTRTRTRDSQNASEFRTGLFNFVVSEKGGCRVKTNRNTVMFCDSDHPLIDSGENFLSDWDGSWIG